jgi:hypothetical protein
VLGYAECREVSGRGGAAGVGQGRGRGGARALEGSGRRRRGRCARELQCVHASRNSEQRVRANVAPRFLGIC